MADVNPPVNYKATVLCPSCKSELVRRYPGNDPENGPPIKWCPNCKLELVPCQICELSWHEDSRPTPKRSELHNSWGHGLPEVDEEDRKFTERFPNPEDEG